MTTEKPYRTQATDVAREASRYLDVVELFASLDADPHANARAHAAHALSRRGPRRPHPQPRTRTRKAVNRWRS